MRGLKIVLLVSILCGCTAGAYPQESPRPEPPLSGEALRQTLQEHSMVRPELRLKDVEHFCKEGRWKNDNNRGPLFGTYDIRGDTYCVQIKGGSERCARLFPRDGDLYARQYLPDGVQIEVRLTPDKPDSCF